MPHRLRIAFFVALTSVFFACSPVAENVDRSEQNGELGAAAIPTGKHIVMVNLHGIITLQKAPFPFAVRKKFVNQVTTDFEAAIKAAASDNVSTDPDEDELTGLGHDFGGQLEWVRSFARVLANHRNQVDILVPSIDGQLHEQKDAKYPGLTIVRLPIGNDDKGNPYVGYRDKYQIIAHFHAIANAGADYYRKKEVDFFLSNFYDAATVSAEIIKQLGRSVPHYAVPHSLGLVKITPGSDGKAGDEDLWGYRTEDQVDLKCVRDDFVAHAKQLVTELKRLPSTDNYWNIRGTVDPDKLIGEFEKSPFTPSQKPGCKAVDFQKSQTFFERLLYEISIYPLADYVVVGDKKKYLPILEMVGVKNDKVVEPDPFTGYNPERFYPVDDTCGSNDKEKKREALLQERGLGALVPYKLAVYAGRPAANKGVFAFLAAMEDLFAKDPALRSSVRGLMFTGTDEDAVVKALKGQIAQKFPGHEVVLVDGEPNYALGDLFRYVPELIVLPSIIEPFGMIIVEAMATGVPVIAGEAAGASLYVKKYCKPGACLLQVNPDNTDAFANEISFALHRPAEARAIARQGADFVKRVFTWERTVDATFSLVNSPSYVPPN